MTEQPPKSKFVKLNRVKQEKIESILREIIAQIYTDITGKYDDECEIKIQEIAEAIAAEVIEQ